MQGKRVESAQRVWSTLLGGRFMGRRARAWARGEAAWVPCVEVARGPFRWLRHCSVGQLVVDGDWLQWRFAAVCYRTPRRVPGSLVLENLTLGRTDQVYVEHYRAPDGTLVRLGTRSSTEWLLALNAVRSRPTCPAASVDHFAGQVVTLAPVTRDGL